MNVGIKWVFEDLISRATTVCNVDQVQFEKTSVWRLPDVNGLPCVVLVHVESKSVWRIEQAYPFSADVVRVSGGSGLIKANEELLLAGEVDSPLYRHLSEIRDVLAASLPVGKKIEMIRQKAPTISELSRQLFVTEQGACLTKERAIGNFTYLAGYLATMYVETWLFAFVVSFAYAVGGGLLCGVAIIAGVLLAYKWCVQSCSWVAKKVANLTLAIFFPAKRRAIEKAEKPGLFSRIKSYLGFGKTATA